MFVVLDTFSKFVKLYSVKRVEEWLNCTTYESTGFTPVSYTHLDVYKRQYIDRLAPPYRLSHHALCACFRYTCKFSSFSLDCRRHVAKTGSPTHGRHIRTLRNQVFFLHYLSVTVSKWYLVPCPRPVPSQDQGGGIGKQHLSKKPGFSCPG